ncbi:MAG TPA: rhodanese-like domain-containing protein [Steroidobacteraceae bacterium]|nr:rhodanese-like domain-containing protein [Steroidobacteraceae bacterium]
MTLPQLSIPAPRAGGAPIDLIADGVAAETTSVLQRARAQAAANPLPYAGDLRPEEAWQLLSSGRARLIDVRTPEERKFVGYVPDSLPVPWATGTGFIRNPRFLRELEGKTRKDEVLLFFCRSGARSRLAAEAATRAQFAHAFNVLEGFEGELDPEQHRGRTGGWRFHGLPWIQD